MNSLKIPAEIKYYVEMFNGDLALCSTIKEARKVAEQAKESFWFSFTQTRY